MSLFSICSLFFTIMFSFFLTGCSSDVSKVKNGTIPGYEKTTIGKAFEASFDDSKWKAFEGKKGERVVQFTGKISKNLHDTALEKANKANKDLGGILQLLSLGQMLPGKEKLFQSLNKEDDNLRKEYVDEVINEFWKPGTIVEVQWIIKPDGNSFDLTYLGSRNWEKVPFKYILDVIYG
jgi:hypothetical protein